MVLSSRGLRNPWREPITQAGRVRALENGKLKVRKRKIQKGETAFCNSLEVGGWLKAMQKYGLQLSGRMQRNEAGELSQSRSCGNLKGSSKKWTVREGRG